MAGVLAAFQPLLFTCLAVLAALAASCSGGRSSSSGTIIVPQAPSGVSHAVSAGPVRVLLSWNSSALADHYRIYRSTASGVLPSAGSHIGYSTITSYTDLAVTSGNTYYYVITAVSASGNEGPPSPEMVVRLAKPVPPHSVLAIGGDRQVSIVWSPVNGASSYSLYRAQASGVSATVANLVASSITGTSHLDATPGITNGQAYYYAVSSVNDFGEGGLSAEASTVPLQTAGTGTVVIQGMIRYEDREYDASRGFTGITSMKPVRFADIEVVDASTPNQPAVASGATGSSGSFSFALPASLLGKTVYLQAISSASVQSGPTATQVVTVMHLDRSLYGSNSPQFTLSGNAQVTIGIPADGAAGAFNILDVLTAGCEFINALDSYPRTFSLDAFWDRGNTIGTWYCIQSGTAVCQPSGEGIYVLSDLAGTGDTDEYDDDVLWHEFGHFAADKRSRDESPGGIHYLNDNDLDLRLSWSEGWGNFFSGAVKYWLDADPDRRQILSPAAGTPLSQYIDTSGSAAHLTIDVAAPELSPYCMSCKYASNEVAVANVLWNIMTEPSLAMQRIWDVVTDVLPAKTPVNLESFWDGWLARMNPGASELTLLKGIFADRLIGYVQDAHEDDSTMSTATTYTVGVSAPQVHTLYPATDGDFVTFFVAAGTSYTIETTNLRNGADTLLTLYDANGSVIATDDNGNGTGVIYIPWPAAGYNYDYYDVFDAYVYPRNTTSNLSSKISFRPPHSGRYVVNITSSPSRPKTAGTYGSYALSITSP